MAEAEGSARVDRARRRGLADEVADRVRDAIFGGVYPPGAPLREVELARDLDVSRGPVREALFRLEAEGLVRSAWHRGAAVTTLTAADVAELDSLRGALERLAVELVVARAGEAELEAISRAVTDMEAAPDAHRMVACDIAFHDRLYAATGHRRLEEAWGAIRNQVHLFLLTRIGISAEDYLARLPAEHRELADALQARGLSSAQVLFDRHRKRAYDVITGKDAQH